MIIPSPLSPTPWNNIKCFLNSNLLYSYYCFPNFSSHFVVLNYENVSYETLLYVCLNIVFIICIPAPAVLGNQSSSFPWYRNTLSSFSISIIFVDFNILVCIDPKNTKYLSSISMLLRKWIIIVFRIFTWIQDGSARIHKTMYFVILFFFLFFEFIFDRF